MRVFLVQSDAHSSMLIHNIGLLLYNSGLQITGQHIYTFFLLLLSTYRLVKRVHVATYQKSQ